MRFSINQNNEENEAVTILRDIEKRLTRIESKMHEFFDENYQPKGEAGTYPIWTMNSKDVERLAAIVDVFDSGWWTVGHAVQFAGLENPKAVQNLIQHARNTEGYLVEDKKMVGNNCKMYRITETSDAAA